MGAAMTLLLSGLLQAHAALATHVIPLVPPPSCVTCNGSPDQCVIFVVVTIVRALMFHPC